MVLDVRELVVSVNKNQHIYESTYLLKEQSVITVILVKCNLDFSV